MTAVLIGGGVLVVLALHAVAAGMSGHQYAVEVHERYRTGTTVHPTPGAVTTSEAVRTCRTRAGAHLHALEWRRHARALGVLRPSVADLGQPRVGRSHYAVTVTKTRKAKQ